MRGYRGIGRLLAAGLFLAPSMFAQKELLQSMQRDVAQLQETIKQVKDAQAQQAAALTALLQQTLDESRKANAAATALQHSLDQRLGDLQTKLTGPVATLGTKVDQMSGDFGATQTSVAELSRLVRKLDERLTDIKTIVSNMLTPVAPPSSNDGGKPSGCTGSAEALFQNAFRDYSSKKEQLALDEFGQYLKCFPETENAPAAQYYIGMVYDSAKQYDDALLAFDAAIKYPPNQRSGDALFMKAMTLLHADRKPEARKVFQDFIDRYPTHPSVISAKAHIRELAPRSGGGTRKKGSH